MTLGKRKQPDRLTETAVGPIRPSAGLRPRHAGVALRSTARLTDLPPNLVSTPGAAPSPGHVRRAARLLIGCARRAGMGSIRAVAGTARALVTWASRENGDLAVAARASVAAAKRAKDDLTLDREEAGAAAALAAIAAAREADPADAARVRAAVASAASRSEAQSPEPRAVPRRAPRTVTECRDLAAAAVRLRVRGGRPAASEPDDLVREAAACLEAAVSEGRPARRSIRDVAHALVRSGHHRGRDVGRLARAVVDAAARCAARIGLSRAEAAGRAAAHSVEAGHALGAHPMQRVWDALVRPPQRGVGA